MASHLYMLILEHLVIKIELYQVKNNITKRLEKILPLYVYEVDI